MCLIRMGFTIETRTAKMCYFDRLILRGVLLEEISTYTYIPVRHRLKLLQHTRGALQAFLVCNSISHLVTINADGVIRTGPSFKMSLTTLRDSEFRLRTYGHIPSLEVISLGG